MAPLITPRGPGVEGGRWGGSKRKVDAVTVKEKDNGEIATVRNKRARGYIIRGVVGEKLGLV